MTSRQIQYNAAQYLAMTRHKKVNMLEWGRGTGKSTILGGVIKNIVYDLPRGKGVIVCSTYVQAMTRTLPSTISGLEMHGLYKDVHFFVGRKAPKSFGWPEPYEPPLEWKHAIHFYNGFVFCLVSQDRPGTGRGLNSDVVIGDEALLLKKTDLDNDVRLTCRGTNKAMFRYSPYFCSEFYTTSTSVTPAGDWIYEFETLTNEDPKKHFFLRAPSYVNIANLGHDYFDRLRKTLYPALYKAEIECIRNKKVQNGFYPLLDEGRHGYTAVNHNHLDTQIDFAQKGYLREGQYFADCRGDADHNPDQPLLIGVDFGAAINCLVVAQMDKALNTLKFIKNMYVLGANSEILDDLARQFAQYYHHHRKKTVYFYYDNTGNNRQANSRMTLADEFCSILRTAGFSVIKKTKGGSNPRHAVKYRIWAKVMREEMTPDILRPYPYVRFNRVNCKELIASMVTAPATMRGKDIYKDKSSERRIAPEERYKATDLTDAVDALIMGIGEGWVFNGAAGLPALL